MLSNKEAEKQADTVFSRYIRSKYGNGTYCTCYTCGRPCKSFGGLYGANNGHFISRGILSTRYEEDNCRPQCYDCNVRHYGEKEQFGMKLAREIGLNRIERLQKLSKKIVSPFERFFLLRKVIRKYAKVGKSVTEW